MSEPRLVTPSADPAGLRSGVVLLCFLAATFLIYARGLAGPFLYDDNAYLVHNPTITSLKQALLTFGRPEALTDGSFNHLAYRPLMPVVYAALYAVFGQWSVGYHLVNLLVHALNGLLVFLLLRRLSIAPRPALLAAGLWLVHPVHVENVQAVTGLDDLLSAGLALGTILLTLAARRRLALLSFAASLLCKEGALIAPGLLFPILVWQREGSPREKLASSLARVAPLVLLGAVFLLVRRHFLPFHDTKAPVQDLATALFVLPKVLLTYLRLLVFPVHLQINYFFELDKSLSLAFVAGYLALGLLIATALICRRRAPSVAIGIFWFLLAFLPVSNLTPLRALAGERFMYLPYFGFAVIAGVAATNLKKRRRPLVVLALLVCLSFAWLSFDRVRVWCDEEVFWKDIIAKEPQFSGYQMYESNLAEYYVRIGRYPEAEVLLRQILKAKPDCLPCAHNLAQYYLMRGKYDRAVPLFEQLTRAAPENELFQQQLRAARRRLVSSPSKF